MCTAGTVMTFGCNHAGQLGLGDYEDRNVPAQIAGNDFLAALTRKVQTGCLNSGTNQTKESCSDSDMISCRFTCLCYYCGA